MTPLRQRMQEDMRLRNFAAGTQASYISQVAAFAKHYDVTPERLGLDEIRNYQLYLIEQKFSPNTINGFVSAVKFLYLQTLERCRALLNVTGLLPTPHEIAAAVRIDIDEAIRCPVCGIGEMVRIEAIPADWSRLARQDSS